ncbi:hypothetical protein GGE56_006615 [Rhizobium leguminosarum]|nr:hypothetical protein [Rhizobium leguminosarum]MBB6298274.1 hypothetical protein [Rhizobium leguminosarum]
MKKSLSPDDLYDGWRWKNPHPPILIPRGNLKGYYMGLPETRRLCISKVHYWGTT